MASLDSLPADQKAVLSLVLQRGQSFDQIAALLSIDRAGVRRRALDALASLGPETTVAPLKQGLITDYLLGQLPAALASTIHSSLATNPPERAWARVVSAELAPLATRPLPDIPAAATAPETVAPGGHDLELDEDRADSEPFTGDDEPFPQARPAASVADTAVPAARAASRTAASPETRAPSRRARPAELPASSRRGGAILLGLIALVIIAVVVVLLLTGSSKKSTPSARGVSPTATTTGTTTPGTTDTSTDATPLHQINLVSPNNVKGREGAADVVRVKGKLGIILLAEGLTANTKNAYGVWLYNSGTKASEFIGFYNQRVTGTGNTKGELEAENALPANATSYNELLLTLETVEHPQTPGTIILQGTFAE